MLEQVVRRMYPGPTVLPTMSTGASDMAQLRAKGIQAYGIGPATTEGDASIMARTATSSACSNRRSTGSSSSPGAR